MHVSLTKVQNKPSLQQKLPLPSLKGPRHVQKEPPPIFNLNTSQSCPTCPNSPWVNSKMPLPWPTICRFLPGSFAILKIHVIIKSAHSIFLISSFIIPWPPVVSSKLSFNCWTFPCVLIFVQQDVYLCLARIEFTLNIRTYFNLSIQDLLNKPLRLWQVWSFKTNKMLFGRKLLFHSS